LSAPGAHPAARSTPRAGLLVHALWLALFAAAFAPTLVWLVERWTRSIWHNGHGLFIPFVLAWLVRRHFQQQPLDEGARGSAWGFAFVLPGLALLALDAAVRTQLASAVGLVLCLPGLALLLVGGARTRALAFPLGLAWFMLPIPAGFGASLYLLLRRISAAGAAELLAWLGIPALRQDTSVLIPIGPVEVSDACSGFSTLYAALAIALVLAHTSTAPRRRLLLLAAAPLLAVGSNIARVALLLALAQHNGFQVLSTRAHELSGVATFAACLAGLFLIAGRARAAEP